MRTALAVLAIFLITMFTPAEPANADATNCGGTVGINVVTRTCEIPGSEAHQKVYGPSDSGHVYKLELDCGTGGKALCSEGIPCVADDGESGFRYNLYEDGIELYGTCLSLKESQPPGEPTPGQVMDAAKNLTWPQATLVIQPPGGETLVNFATNFYTTTTEPATKKVSLIDVAVTIQATPSAYIWIFGDGHSMTSREPGAPYPRLTITHTYLHKGTVKPALDVTYSGRYRIGDGDWKALPDTLTVKGTPQQLSIRTATPHLVDSD